MVRHSGSGDDHLREETRQGEEACREGSGSADSEGTQDHEGKVRRKEGATIAEIAKVTNWLNHSIRGFLSGQSNQQDGPQARIRQRWMGNADIGFWLEPSTHRATNPPFRTYSEEELHLRLLSKRTVEPLNFAPTYNICLTQESCEIDRPVLSAFYSHVHSSGCEPTHEFRVMISGILHRLMQYAVQRVSDGR